MELFELGKLQLDAGLPLRRFLLGGLLLAACGRDPDVLLLTVDTLRVDHVGAFSEESPAQTPNMDRLATDGIRFTQAFSPISVTGPAFATLHTGKDPGAFTFAAIDRARGDGIVILTNSDNGWRVILPILERTGSDPKLIAFLRGQMR